MSTIPAWAVRGAKVVCIVDLRPYVEYGEVVPEVGKVYTIRSVDADGIPAALLLEEIDNPANIYAEGLTEACFGVENFRPITKRTAEQDIAEHFARHLTAPEGVNA